MALFDKAIADIGVGRRKLESMTLRATGRL